ncbi:RNA pol II transcription cofactor [Suhomyces tanzawaensis NRRL Y-17324]|uniref:RNA pol II transcription cofactor n=1 Tax=Suhomyces tanzawaensis NRRL Y-17324 TaxID=984487 RepID=A0A1E4SPS8_9ASCO|nr:RNA pol II transcription cofactor [Suhomyces tanzawaensis NRRL Y-17324]ODV81402.1 RNA pol II transcription cofactor [Suhomyces tanzawaensis NRRL Y-17324]
MPALRTVKNIIHALEKAEGVGAHVRRSIGVRAARNFTPFLMLDHFASGGPGGFPQHPHSGQETITYIMKGAMAHEDFTGSKGILYSGDLQFMTAGKGVVHSEMPIPNEDGSPTVGLQLWVDLPEHLKDVEPRYRDLRAWEIPEVVQQDGRLRIKVISGKGYGIESIKELAYTPVNYYHYQMKPGSHFRQELQNDFNYFLYVLKGNSLVLNNDTQAKQHHNLFFDVDGDAVEGVNPESGEDVEFVIIGGQKLDQEIVQNGPFVATSKDGIKKAFVDYQYAQNGFENLRSWKSLISNGVSEEMIQGPLDGNLEKREQTKNAYLAKHKNHENDEL